MTGTPLWGRRHPRLAGGVTVIAVAQLAPVIGDPGANRRVAADAVAGAAVAGAGLVVLPEPKEEHWASLMCHIDSVADAAEDIPTPDWPLFGLRLRCGNVVLRLVRERDLPRLAAMQPPDYEHDPRAEAFWSIPSFVHTWFCVSS